MADVGRLEEEAIKRRERLKALKKRDLQNGSETVDGKIVAKISSERLPKPMFRSYKPHDEKLKEAQLTPAELTEVKEQVKDQLEQSKPEPIVDTVDLINLAPRKPDWDLKRDVAKKLEKLERRTQRAIAELIRERLEAEGTDDFVTALNANVQARTNEDAED